MKKILFFHQSGAIGGAGISLLHILKSIDRSQYDVSVVCPTAPEDMIKAIRVLGYKVIGTEKTPILFPHYNGGIKYAFSPRTVINIFQLIRDKKRVNDIIRSEEPSIVAVNSMALSHIGKYATKYGASTVCFDRETFQKGFFGLRTSIIKKWLSCYFDRIVFISKYDFEQLSRKCRGRKSVVYDKVDMKIYENGKTTKTTDSIKVLYLGGVSKLKGIHIILDAANYLQNEDIEFNMVADGGAICSIPTIIDRVKAKLGLTSISLARVYFQRLKRKEHIHFIPPSMHPENYFLENDIVVFPSTIAHQARPVYEAGAAKKPIIISDFPETREFCENGINVITFTPCDGYDLAQKLTMLIRNKNDWERIVNDNYQRTMKYHNLDDLAEELSEVFKDL